MHRQDEDYQLILSYEGFGIAEEEEYKYAYMWIASQAYYVDAGKVCTSSGRAIQYKFIFKDGNVVKYETPKDGASLESSVRKLFPKSISDKMLKYDFSKLVENNSSKAKEHYSYLELKTDIS